MAGAGFYSIHTDKLRFRADGRWYADDDPILHPRLASLFSRHLRRKGDGGYEIWIDERYHADVDVEDTPYVVVAVEADSRDGVNVELNDGTTEKLSADGLRVGENDALYCRVKQGSEDARFLRSAYNQLADRIVQNEVGDFSLRCGGNLYPIATH
jgi:hypothetical protein